MAGHADDFELLDRFARARDEPAFAEVVRRYLNLVYSSAVRRVGDRHLAEDVTQAVFVILAKKAKSIRTSRAPLSAWLLTTVRYAAANALKIESRRRKHEEAAAMVSGAGACSTNPSDVIVWQEVAAQLDDAVLKLPALDRQAILMRYFEDRPITEIAAALRMTEGAAKMRLSRSVEKLRQRLERAGADVAPAGAASLMTMLATHAVRAAPGGLMQYTVAASLGGAAANAGGAGAGIAIAKGAIAMMTWTKMKIAAAVIVAAMLGTGAVLTVNFAGAQSPKAQDAPAADNGAEKTETPPAGEAEGGEDKASLATASPVVVKTMPLSGAAGVDPKITEIRVTYSKAMKNGGWSWSTWGEENFPKTTGKPRYEADKRTCVLPVKLEPNKFYAIWLNSSNFGNFQDAGGRRAVPYLLVFKTK